MKNWIKRALRTFIQAAAGYACTAVVAVDWTSDRAVLKATLVGIFASAIAAGISAVMNYLDDSNNY